MEINLIYIQRGRHSQKEVGSEEGIIGEGFIGRWEHVVPLVAIGWVEFDEGYWRAGENPDPSRGLCDSRNAAQPSFIWRAQALKGLPGTRQDPSLRGPVGN